MKRSQDKLTADQIKAFSAVARKVDVEESREIKHQAREAFRQHEGLRILIDALKSVRLRRKLSLSDVARLSGISKPNLSRLENNVRSAPTLETLQRYASALGKKVRLQLAAA